MYLDNGIWKWNYTPSVNKSTGYEDVIDSLNIISVADFKQASSAEQDKYVAEVLQKIRAVNVYPIYYYTEQGIRDEIMECTYCSPAFTGKAVQVNSRAGSTLLDFMFPNMHLAEAGSAIDNCLYSRFYDDVKLSKCIHRHMKNYRFTSMRTMFFMYGRFFWNTATNFNMGRAKAIYQRVLPNGGTIYDYSCGFGARMLGALTDRRAEYTYIGCEPDINTSYNLRKLGPYIEDVTGRKDTYNIITAGSEIYRPEPASIDFAFSCPPYFSLERYSKERTQSYNKYRSYKDWLQYYVVPTQENIYAAVKQGGYFGFVIGDIRHMNKLIELRKDWCDVAKSIGFKPVLKAPIVTRSRKRTGGDTLYIFKKG